MRIATTEGVSLRQTGDSVEVLVNGVPILDVYEDGVCLLDLPESFDGIDKNVKEVVIYSNEYKPRDVKTPVPPGDVGLWKLVNERGLVKLMYDTWYVAHLTKDGLKLMSGILGSSVPFPVDSKGQIVVKEWR